MTGRTLTTRSAVLALAVGLAGCAQNLNQAGDAEFASTARRGQAEDHLLYVRSNFWSPLAIDLVGEGFRRRLGIVNRLEPRTFRMPARLVGSGLYVSLDARPSGDGAGAGYSTELFTLGPGEAADLLLEHTLTMSTFEIRRR